MTTSGETRVAVVTGGGRGIGLAVVRALVDLATPSGPARLVRATRAALPSLLDRRGAVVGIGSVNARLPQPRLVAQSAAKAALSNLGKALAEEFGGRGLRVNTISPGPVWTDVWTSPGGPGDLLARRAGIAREDFSDRLPGASACRPAGSPTRRRSRRWWCSSPPAGWPT